MNALQLLILIRNLTDSIGSVLNAVQWAHAEGVISDAELQLLLDAAKDSDAKWDAAVTAAASRLSTRNG